MADTEEYFPRGGKKTTGIQFKPSVNFLGAIAKGEKKKKRQKKADTDDGYLSDEGKRYVDTSYKFCATGLTYETIKAGLIILGRVKAVRDTKIFVSLPGKMAGTVMACHISEPYNKVLEAYVNDKADKVTELQAMFKPGQYVAVKVLEVDDDHRMLLSLMPNHVNDGKHHGDLKIGCVLPAAVLSVEDHGFVMDIGIKGTRAFLPKTYTNPEVELDVGMVLWCAIKSVSPSTETSIVTLSSDLSALQKAVLRSKPRSGLTPGSLVEFHVEKCLENGIEGRVFDETAYIPRYQVDMVNGKKPVIGKTIRARILYTMPTSNAPFLTLKKVFDATYPDLNEEQLLQDGDIVEEAQVIKITGRSIHFRLGRGCIGTMSIRRLQVDEDLADEEVVAKSYPLGSKHKVRILNYNLSDFVYSVTDEASLVNEKYFSLRDFEVGDIVSGEVVSTLEDSVVVKIGRITGVVHHAHFFDSGVYVDPKKGSSKKLSKKFKRGQKVTARVLVVDPGHDKLVLTLKPSLVDPEVEAVASVDQAEVGKAYTGVIKAVRDFILVSFFNKVTVFVPHNLVSNTPLDNLAEAFHVGQIVKCTIMKKDTENKKLLGSLITEPFWPEPKPPHKNKRKHDFENNPVATKRHKTDDTTEQSNKKKDRNKSEDEGVEIDKQDSKKKRKKKDSITEDNETDNQKVKNKSDIQDKEVDSKKKKKRKESVSDDLEVSEGNSKHKKNKNKLITEDNEHEINKKLKKKKNENTDAEESTKESKKKKKDKTKEVSEESDAIETDINDTDQLLTAQELFLTDLTDCTTEKQWKKRIVALIKAIKNRTDKIERIENKIDGIEARGLHTYNQMYHRAMYTDKLILEERVKKLLEVLKVAQDKLKEMGGKKNEDYKLKQKKKIKKLQKTQENPEQEPVRKEEENKTQEVEEKLKEKIKSIKVVESLEPALEVPSAKDFWTAGVDTLAKKVVEDSSSSDEEEQEQPKKKRKKLTVAEKLAKAREEEERVREMERRAIDSETQPRSSDQFERALLANPNCSQLWIAYMAFHLQATEIEKARAVGRKALSTIGFREEQDRLNVWIALLNCEHRFGTKETQQKTLEDAIQMNEPFQVHSKLLDILVDTGKTSELSALVDLMLRKYKRDPKMYIACGEACYKAAMMDKARQVMQKAVAVLEKKEHVTVLVQFALMESRVGVKERAEAIFEQVLAVYPQRVDVCAVYADMLAKAGDIDQVRQVMERMTSQKLPARKMKVLYRKWGELEERLGDQQHVEDVRQRAANFIEKAQF